MESRRSHPNLTYLTLSPISTRLPVDNTSADEPEDVPQPWQHRTSYIAGKSAPTTPRILSRSPSQTRLSRVSSTKLAKLTNSKSYNQVNKLGLGDTDDEVAASGAGGLVKNKSTGQALYLGGVAERKRSKRKSKHSRHQSTDNGEWLFRTGAGITTEARESKGQSWLVSRESSTSLVHAGSESEDETETEARYAPIRSAMASRMQSQAVSTMGSARQSRRGSKVGIGSGIAGLTTPGAPGSKGSSSARLQAVNDYFGTRQGSDPAVLAGPDFVDEEEFDESDESDREDEEEQKSQEEEVKRLTSEDQSSSLGFGGMVDRLLNWRLFEEVAEDEVPPSNPDMQKKLREQKARLENVPASEQSIVEKQEDRPKEEAHGWSDAAWLLSVASKVIL